MVHLVTAIYNADRMSDHVWEIIFAWKIAIKDIGDAPRNLSTLKHSSARKFFDSRIGVPWVVNFTYESFSVHPTLERFPVGSFGEFNHVYVLLPYLQSCYNLPPIDSYQFLHLKCLPFITRDKETVWVWIRCPTSITKRKEKEAEQKDTIKVHHQYVLWVYEIMK